MALRGPNIKDLETANAQYKVGLSNASGVQEYKLMDPDYFLHGADIKNKLMSFCNDEEGANKPGVYASPNTPPANPAPGATLIDVFDDYFVYWRWNAGTTTWDKITEQDRFEHCQLSYFNNGLGAAPQTGFIVPAYMNGWVLRVGCVQNDTNSFAIPVQVFKKNGVVFGPGFTQGAGGTTCVNFAGGTTVASGDLITINQAAFPAAPVQVQATITLQKP